MNFSTFGHVFGMGGNQQRQEPQQQNGGNNGQQSANNGQQGQQGGNGQPQNNGQQNNDGNNNSNHLGIWDTDPQAANQGGPGGDNPQQQADPNALQTRFDQYLGNMSFSQHMDRDKLAAALSTGDVQGVNQQLDGFGRAIMRQALQDVGRIVDNAVERAVSQAVDKSKSFYHGNQSVSKMIEKLPYTADKDLMPVAQSVLGRALQKNNGDMDAALKTVDAFFKKVGSLNGNAPRGSAGSGGFGNAGGSGGDDDNWMDFLAN